MVVIQVFRSGALVQEVRTDADTLDIGRDARCAVVLDDPSKYISRLHATLARSGEGWMLTVHTRVNPVMVDSLVLHTGQTAPVTSGARIVMSPFELVMSSAQAVQVEDGVLPVEPPAQATRPPVEPAAASSDESTVDEQTSLPARRAAADAASVRAFLRGCGLSYVQVPAGEEQEFLEQAGAVLERSIEALMRLMMVRNQSRQSLQAADPTLVGGRERNALRMIANPAEAMRSLLDPAQRRADMMAPLEAIGDAAAELEAHEAALLAGMRSALLGLLQRFEPEGFERSAAEVGGALGLNKKARAWEALVDTYDRLARDSAKNVDRLAQQDFLRGYAEHMRSSRRD